MRFGLVIPLALEPNEGDELLVLLLRQRVRDAGDEALHQRDPLLESELAGLVHESSDGRVVHPCGLWGRGHQGGSERGDLSVISYQLSEVPGRHLRSRAYTADS